MKSVFERMGNRDIPITVGETWLDEAPGTTHPWFRITAYDEASGVILGYRWPTPFPNPGQSASKFIAEHPRLGVADVSHIDHFRKWCCR